MSDITDIFCYVSAQPGRQGFFLFRAKRCSSWCQLNPVYSIPKRILFGRVSERKKKCVFSFWDRGIPAELKRKMFAQLNNKVLRRSERNGIFYIVWKGMVYYIQSKMPSSQMKIGIVRLSRKKKRQSIHCSLGKVFLHYIIARIFTLCSTDEKISAKL